MKAWLAMAAVVALAACSAPYETALDSRTLMRPEPPVTKADLAARTPYDSSTFFQRKN
ncbi:hypothetical protein [Magnetospirillum sp. UT-4]|uniref:hypothetical protein n=1 Tax=Magnetospirillum sp. UT-4 TaxID=2681467 RepID=UPI0013864908|nr:hypothetical protein [Magnetospirillum sp. UT-4]CAA7613623.1 conserved exported hypothetical protein [Magnetospirillum sp. UT-4]